MNKAISRVEDIAPISHAEGMRLAETEYQRFADMLVAVRASGSFRVGKVDGINARYCRLLQSCDGYSYGLVDVQAAEMPPRQLSKRSASFLPMLEKQGYPEAVV